MTKTKDNKEQTISIHPVKFALQPFNKVNIARKASKYLLVFVISLVIFSGLAPYRFVTGQAGVAEAEIIPADRIIDWSQSGIPGGIPSRDTICATVNASTYGNGSSDATSGIQAALNNCPSGQTVLLSAGTFRINSSLSIPSNKTLRGAGADKTILNGRGSGEGIIRFGSSDATSGGVNITSGATKGSISIVVSNASGMAVGGLLHISELNDPSLYVTNIGEQGPCSWCDAYWSGGRARGQIVEITSVNGTTIGITPLYSDYTKTPQALVVSVAATNAGVENLQLYANKTGYAAMIAFRRVKYCWAKGVEVNFSDLDHVEAYWSFRCEIRDSYFHDSFRHIPGDYDSDIVLGFKTSGFLIENNILTRLHGSIMFEWGSAGNVAAYNYMTGNYGNNGTGDQQYLYMNLSQHGAHPQFNLWEGNIADSIHPDGYWGSGGWLTIFRNWATGMDYIYPPRDARGAPQPGYWATAGLLAFAIDDKNAYTNLVGNVAGTDEINRQNRNESGQSVAPASRIQVSDYNFGYGLNGSYTGTPAYTTAFIHGNYSHSTGGIISWASGVDHTLHASYYLTSKPSWFGSVPWPPIGPDVTGGISDSDGYAYSIPAKVCYDNAVKDSNGYAIFNADTCYVSSVPDTIPPSISNGSPAGTLPTGITQTTMSVSTNENAVCRWSSTSGVSYSSMTNTFSNTGGTSHSTTITGLSNGQTYNRYIRCQDTVGNANTSDYTITFSVGSLELSTGGLIAAYSFDEGSGTQANDSSGNSNTGTISGATWTSSGKYGNALSFDGVNNYLNLNDSSSLDFNKSSGTISMWLKPTNPANGNYQAIVVDSDYKIELNLQSDGDLFYYPWVDDPVHSNFNLVTNPLTSGSWQYVAVTWNYSTKEVKIYVDGISRTFAIEQVPAYWTTIASTANWHIGGSLAKNQYFNGLIDEVRIYNRALSQSEIQTDMNTPIGNTDITPPAAPTGLTVN